MHHNKWATLPGDLYDDDTTKIWKTLHAILQLNSSSDRASLIWYFDLFEHNNNTKFTDFEFNLKTQNNRTDNSNDSDMRTRCATEFLHKKCVTYPALEKQSNWTCVTISCMYVRVRVRERVFCCSNVYANQIWRPLTVDTPTTLLRFVQ